MPVPGSERALFICGAESQFVSAGAWLLRAKAGKSFQDEPDRVGGSKAPSQNPCLKSLHRSLQQSLASKEMYFKEDVHG